MSFSVRGSLIQATIGFILGTSAAVAAAQAQASVQYRLTAQPLADALRAVATQASLNVVFDPPVVPDRMAPALQAELTTREVLSRLLEGTGLAFEFVSERTVAIHLAAASPGSQAQSETSAQRPDEAAKSALGPDALQEIIVTAQKKGEERLQDVPIPIAVLRADTLADNGLFRLQDYYSKIPGLTLSKSVRGDAFVAVRGLVTGYGANPSVGATIDDVSIGSPVNSGAGFAMPELDPSDLERIEVLRGPQGTFYGSSTLGGLIRFVTVEPSTDRLSGQVQVGTSGVKNGDGLGYNARGAVNVPLSESWALRASAYTRREPGYIDDPVRGVEGVNRTDAHGGRLVALWRPSDAVSLKLGALIQRHERRAGDQVSGNLANLEPSIGDLQQTSLQATGFLDDETQLYDANLKVSLGRIDLASISAYSIRKVRDSIDLTPFYGALTDAYFGVPGTPLIFEGRTANLTQELRLSAPLGDRIDSLFGALYTRVRTPAADRTQTILAIDPATGDTAGVFLNSYAPSTFEEYAAFANLTFKITDRFDVQIGARKSYFQHMRADTSIGPWVTATGGTASPAITPALTVKDDAFTYLLTPRFKLSPDLMLYARLASGYRPGGPNGSAAAYGYPADYGPDKTQNYEIGVKGEFLNHALSVDASLFYIDWKDIQLFVSAEGTAYVTNASEARSQGLELSLEARPLRGLGISASATWNDAKLTEDCPTCTVSILSGEKLPYSSRFSGTFSLDQEIDLTSNVTGFIGGSVTYVGERIDGFQGSPLVPRFKLPSYTQANVHAGMNYDSWTVNLFVNNVTDKRGIQAIATGYNYIYYVQPRTVGLSITRAF